MTEAEWLAATDVAWMLEGLRNRLSQRELRLFACACCRSIWRYLTIPECEAVQAAERLIGPQGQQVETEEEVCALRDRLVIEPAPAFRFPWRQGALQDSARLAVLSVLPPLEGFTPPLAHQAAQVAASHAREAMFHCGGQLAADFEQRTQVALLRDIAGNPFRRLSLRPEWLTEGIVTLARSIDTNRSFEALPVLADALEEAGCSDEGVLEHLRDPDPHAWGCWVLQAVLRGG